MTKSPADLSNRLKRPNETPSSAQETAATPHSAAQTIAVATSEAVATDERVRVPTSRKCVRIFTDGSCDTAARAGGWGYLLVYGEHRKTASGFQADTTNNRMELTAAVEALTALGEPCRVSVVTDSQYLKKAFTAGWLRAWQRNGWRTAGKQAVKNQDLWERLLALSRFHDLTWEWTKGHAGHAENELVDRLALQARKNRGR